MSRRGALEGGRQAYPRPTAPLLTTAARALRASGPSHQSSDHMKDRPYEPHITPVVLGDVSVARYPNGDEVIEGHAFGIAWHLRGLERPAMLVSRVGDDPAGDRVVQALEAWDVPTIGIQRAVGESTGIARVMPHETTSRLVDREGQPWDRISLEATLFALRSVPSALLVFGTRCMGSASNRRVLEQVLEETDAPVYFDVSHEPAWLAEADLERLLRHARWATAQRDELQALGALLGFAADEPDALAGQLRDAFGLDALFVMDGVNGAFAITADGARHGVVPVADLDVIDRTGVRQAFSAVAVYGLLARWSIPDILGRALGFVELVAALPSPEIPSGAFYEDVRAHWRAVSDRGEPPSDSIVRATPAISPEARLPAALEQTVTEIDELRERRDAARMRAAAAEEVAKDGDQGSRESSARARRSLARISDRVEESERRLGLLRRAARHLRDEAKGEVEPPRC